MYAPDGKLLLSGAQDSMVKVWDLQTGQLSKKMNAESGKINSAVYSPTGKYIASGSHDKYIRIWDAQSGVLLKMIGTGCAA